MVFNLGKQRKLDVLMVGIGVTTSTGIATVVNNWMTTDFPVRVNVDYLSTQRISVPGAYGVKFRDGLLAYLGLAGLFLLRLLRLKGRWDVMHVHQSSYMSFWRKQPIWHLGRLVARRRVSHLHGSEFREFFDTCSPFGKRLVQRYFERADSNMVLAPAWKAWVEGIIRHPTRVDIVYNAALKREVPDRQGRDTVTFSLMGRMGKRKGAYDLLEAFAQVAEEHPEARLILAGDGEVADIRALVAEHGLEGRVEVPGWVSGEDAAAVYTRSDVYCLPSYNEGLPGSILEAMAARLPVLSTPVGGILEAVHDQETGIIVEPGDVQAIADALRRFVKDANFRREAAGESYRLFLDKFDLEAIIDQVIGIYEELSR